MEFLDEESRPKFLFQSRFTSGPSPEPEPHKINKPITYICITIALPLLVLSLFFLQSETLSALLLWFSLSLLIGPFAPISFTGGDIHVGQGELLEPLDLDPIQNDEQQQPPKKRRSKTRRPSSEEDRPVLDPVMPTPEKTEKKKKNVNLETNGGKLEESEWTDEDFDLLKKQISKHPVGEPRRWELITEAFKGRHGMENVIKTAKSFSKPNGGDSFSQFLKQRKPVDKRIEAEFEETKQNEWTSGEDIALLNALKVFPKEVSMRWEKIAAAVPGKTKASCMKRVTELKRDFRSSKASAE